MIGTLPMAALATCFVAAIYGLPAATTDSAATASTALLSGTVTGADGKAASGAGVTVTAWPSGETQDSLTDGDPTSTLPMSAVGASSTNASGAYTVSADFSNLPADYVQGDGGVNLEGDTNNGGDLQITFVAAAFPGSVAAAQDGGLAVPGARPAVVGFNMATTTIST